MNLFSQLKKILNRFILKTSGLIFVFIVAGNLIAIQSGITNQLSKIFYWEEGGKVAGEYTVAITAAGITHPRVVAKQTDFDQIKQHVANNENPWKKQYDAAITQVAGYSMGDSVDFWNISDNWDTIKSETDSRNRSSGKAVKLYLICLFTNDAVNCDKAKDWLLRWTTAETLAVIESYGQDPMHAMNSMVISTALGYDWLYHKLNASEAKQVNNWLKGAIDHIRSVHEENGSRPYHNKHAWDDVTMAVAGLAIDPANETERVKYSDIVKYAIGSPDPNSKSLVVLANNGMIQTDGRVCDSNGGYGCTELSHNLLSREAFWLSYTAVKENGNEYESLFDPIKDKFFKTLDFYAPLYITGDLASIGTDFQNDTRNSDSTNPNYKPWVNFGGAYEIGYKYLKNNITQEVLSSPNFNDSTFNEGVPRYCNTSSYGRCMRWMEKVAVLVWGQPLGTAPIQTCAEQGGDVCLASETCLPPNSWLSAYGTTMCCSGACQSSGIDCSSCGPWQSASSCNTNGCSGVKPREQTRTGCPTGCSTSQCVPDASCGGSCTPGSSCTTAQSCPGTYNSNCVCVDVVGDNCPTGGSAGNKIKIADNARDPAIAVDKTGAAHIVYETNCYLKNGRPLSCDMMYVKYICQNQQGVIDESSRKKIGTGANARVAPDANNNIHIAWDHPGISGREGIKYNRIENGNPVWTEGRLLFANPPGVEKARIAVDNNNEVYISFQNMPHVSFVHFGAATFSPSTPAFPALFTTAQNIDQNPDSDSKGVRQGGIAADGQNNVHFSWSHYPEGGYYRKYGNGTFYAVQRVTQGLGEQATSDFTSISVNKNNGDIVYTAQPGNVDNPSNPFYGHLWYQNLGADVNNEKLSGYNFGTEVGLIDDGDHLNVEVAVDTRNISYVTFAGSNLKTQIEEEKDANGIPYSHACGDNVCHWYYESFEQNVPGMEYCPNDCGHYAYYFTVDQSGAYSGEAAFRLTPGSVNNNQGGKKTNPVPAPARNQGVYVVFEDNAENINYNAYLISLDGADVCGQAQSLSLKADFNCDGKVDVQDFGILLSHWEKTEPPAILEHYANAGCANTNTPEKNLDLNCGKKIINNQEVRDIHIDGDDFGPLLGCWGTPDPVVSAVCYGASQCQ